MAQSATLSSSSGTANIFLNPVAKSTTISLTLSSTGSSGAVQVDMTLDDPSAVPAPTIQWTLLSSVAAMLSSNLTAGGLTWTVLSPIGGVRINSTANNTANTFTLKTLQSITA